MWAQNHLICCHQKLLHRPLLSEKPSCKNTPSKAANKRFTHLAIAGEKADALQTALYAITRSTEGHMKRVAIYA
jgi:hypothetical protein